MSLQSDIIDELRERAQVAEARVVELKAIAFDLQEYNGRLVAANTAMHAKLADLKLVIPEWPKPRHASSCDHSCGAGCTNHKPCNCGHAAVTAARSKARHIVGLEIPQ